MTSGDALGVGPGDLVAIPWASMGNTWVRHHAFREDIFDAEFQGFPRIVGGSEWEKMAGEAAMAGFDGEVEDLVQVNLASQRTPEYAEMYRKNTGFALDLAASERALRSRMDAHVRGQREVRRAEFLDPELVPEQDGERHLTTATAGQAILELCAARCGTDAFRGHDIVHDLWCDFGIEEQFSGPGGPRLRAAWDGLLLALGFPSVARGVPWWASLAYPSDHHVGFTRSGGLRELLREVREVGLDRRIDVLSTRGGVLPVRDDFRDRKSVV